MITVVGDLVVDLVVKHHGGNYATDAPALITTHAGGQANHVAAWIAINEEPVTLIGRVGQDLYGDFLLNDAEKLGVTLAVDRDASLETGKIVLLVDGENSERSMFTDRGANAALNVDQVKRVAPTIMSSNCIYVSGYSLFESKTREASMFAKETALEHNIMIAVDPSSTYFLEQHKEWMLDFIQHTDFFFPNLEEGILLTGQKDPAKIMAALREWVKYPILKLGSDGCMFYQDDLLNHLPAKNVTAVDTTGAGDSFIGSFLANYMKTNSVEKAAITATNTAAITVQKYGGRP
ncbi:PfkB family carbohydrate kinase [Aquibacillus sp. 3ASR75-11]|uniref:PfkB family carbohydrate kinase n=1 Tax=Terrihalobacillus insolitus TaxID=2950438 RepID=A0A9X4AMX9_9BACI|nr:PfkB family carbohydrate kinase [Terrihalobacillus insolitus]MDC3413450.1 PfkB family carbohydrate kinase [Terrihalobacillus insolitus]MDC3425259.1 PfkB family carbohydrate kinase [Terrihalobacillus insolitus]